MEPTLQTPPKKHHFIKALVLVLAVLVLIACVMYVVLLKMKARQDAFFREEIRIGEVLNERAIQPTETEKEQSAEEIVEKSREVPPPTESTEKNALDFLNS